MNLPYAFKVAASFDFNRDGFIKNRGFSRELDFDSNARARTDFNRDGHITVEEFAHALSRGDVLIGYDREVHCANPYGNPGYPYPGGGSPYYPGNPSGPVTYPGSGYGYGGGYGGGVNPILGVAALGGAIGYISNGSSGLEKGAVIGGFIGALGSIFGQ